MIVWGGWSPFSCLSIKIESPDLLLEAILKTYPDP